MISSRPPAIVERRELVLDFYIFRGGGAHLHICTTTTKINTGGKKEKVNNKVHYNIQQFINLYESIWLREEEKPLTGFFSQRQLLEDDKMLNNHSERSSSPLSDIFTISNIHRAYIVNVQLAVLCGSPLTGVYNVHPPRPHTHNRHMPRCLNQLIFIKLKLLSGPRHSTLFFPLIFYQFVVY